MFVYQIYPNHAYPTALLRSEDGLWDTAEVFADDTWKPSTRASLIFSLHNFDDGEYITEQEALRFQKNKNIGRNKEEWVSSEEPELVGSDNGQNTER